MKYFALLSFLTLIIFDSLGVDKYVKSPSKDTVFLVNKIPHFEFKLSYIDKFGDCINIGGIKENQLVAEMSYIEVETPSSNYWLRKGNHYILYHDGYHPMIETFSKDEIQNNETMFFAQLYQENSNLSKSWIRRQREIKDNVFHIKCELRYLQKIDYLNRQKEHVSPLFYDMCNRFFLVEYLEDLLYLFDKQGEENIKQILLNYRDVTDWDDLLFSQTYKQFILSYVLLLKSEFPEDFSRIKEHIRETISDYFLFNKIKDNVNKDLLIEFFNDCQDEDYKDYIKQKWMAKDKFLISKDLFLKIDLSQISLEDMLSQYKGKFIYIDICASWCAPCRKLFPLSHKLQAYFKEDIVFIYLSIDDNCKLWINVVNNENFDKNNCYLISEKSNFITEHRIINDRGIPYYLIFDRRGKLIVDNAMRPDDPNFIEKMDEILSDH